MIDLLDTWVARTGNYSGTYIFIYKCFECYQEDEKDSTKLVRYSTEPEQWFPICDLCLADDLQQPPSIGYVVQVQSLSTFLGYDESFIVGGDFDDSNTITDQAHPYKYTKIL